MGVYSTETYPELVIANTGADAGRADMRARANTMAIQPAACANRSDMGAGMHALVADAGARGDNRAGMPACRDAVLVHARTGANRTNMGPSANAFLADMSANAHTQHFNIRTHGIGGDRRQQSQGKAGGNQDFHGDHPLGFHTETDGGGGSSA